MRAAIRFSAVSLLLCTAPIHAQPAASGAPAQPAAAVSGSTPVSQASACGPLQFVQEVIMGDATTQLCPRPVDGTLELLSAKLERAPAKNTAVFFEVLRELRDHLQAPATVPQSAAIVADAAASGIRPAQAAPPASAVATAPASASDWRAALAEDIDEALAQAKAEQRPLASFAAVRGAQADLDPESCLIMTGDAGQPDYACYVIAGSSRPQPLTAAASSMHVYQLADFADAYLAQRALAVAYAALVKLDLPSLDAAIKRLELAEQRWDNLRKRGYLQYPWELAFSSVFAAYQDYQACFVTDRYCTGEQGLDPERTRLIALHPGVGMGFSGFGWKKGLKPSADAALALSLELVGVTLYADDFKNYFGASLGALVNDGDFRDVRAGIFLHLTRWLHAGYLLSLFREGTRYDATLFLSSDLGTAFGADFLN